jgi:hypothetical protein
MVKGVMIINASFNFLTGMINIPRVYDDVYTFTQGGPSCEEPRLTQLQRFLPKKGQLHLFGKMHIK